MGSVQADENGSSRFTSDISSFSTRFRVKESGVVEVDGRESSYMKDSRMKGSLLLSSLKSSIPGCVHILG